MRFLPVLSDPGSPGVTEGARVTQWTQAGSLQDFCTDLGNLKLFSVPAGHLNPGQQADRDARDSIVG